MCVCVCVRVVHEKKVKLECVEGQRGAVLLRCRDTVRSGETGRETGVRDKCKFSNRMDELVVDSAENVAFSEMPCTVLRAKRNSCRYQVFLETLFRHKTAGP